MAIPNYNYEIHTMLKEKQEILKYLETRGENSDTFVVERLKTRLQEIDKKKEEHERGLAFLLDFERVRYKKAERNYNDALETMREYERMLNEET